jgi:hypothetical protein
MAQSNNLNTVNQDLTSSYFNNFFGPTFNVSQDVDESIISFFEKTAANKESALAMARAVIYTAKAQNLDPMVILQKFAAMPAGQINAYLAMFLNLNRVGTSYLGVSNAPITNKYISRAILL